MIVHCVYKIMNIDCSLRLQDYEYTVITDFHTYSKEIIDVFPDLKKALILAAFQILLK